MSDSRPEVRVGGEHYVLRPFKGFKAVLILDRMTKLLDVLPEIQSEAQAAFRRQREENQVEIPRVVFAFRYPEHAGQISEKAWEEAGQVIKLPDGSPLDSMTAFMAVLPKALGIARTEVLEVLALVTLRDDDLERYDAEDTVDEEIKARAKQLLHKGELEELAELGLASFKQIQEMNSGKVRELVGLGSMLLGPDLPDEDDPIPVDENPTSQEDSSETSSTSSPGSTDGPVETPSVSDGMTSSPSPSE